MTKPTQAVQGLFSCHSEELLWEPELQCLHFCVVLSLIQARSSWWKDSWWLQHALDSSLGAVRGTDSVWRLEFLNNVVISQLKEHIKDRVIFPPFQCSCYSLWQKKSPTRFSKLLSNLPCFYILLFLEKKSGKNISCVVSVLNRSFRQGLPYFFKCLALQKWIALRHGKNQPFHLVNDKILIKTCFHFRLSLYHTRLCTAWIMDQEQKVFPETAENVPNTLLF